MKKIVYILSAATVALFAYSCEQFLDSESPSAFDAKTVYSNYGLAEGTVIQASPPQVPSSQCLKNIF